MSAGGSVLAEVLGQLPAGEGEDGLPAAIACVEVVPFFEVLARCGAFTLERPVLLLRAPPGGEVPCTAPILRNDVSKCAGTADVVLVTPVSLEGAGVFPIDDA